MPPKKRKNKSPIKKGPAGFKHQPSKGPPAFNNPSTKEGGQQDLKKKENKLRRK